VECAIGFLLFYQHHISFPRLPASELFEARLLRKTLPSLRLRFFLFLASAYVRVFWVFANVSFRNFSSPPLFPTESSSPPDAFSGLPQRSILRSIRLVLLLDLIPAP